MKKWVVSRSVCPSGLTHSLTITHSLTHSLNLTVETLGCSALSQLARTFVRSFVRSCVHSFVRSFGRSFLRSFVRCVRSFSRCVRAFTFFLSALSLACALTVTLSVAARQEKPSLFHVHWDQHFASDNTDFVQHERTTACSTQRGAVPCRNTRATLCTAAQRQRQRGNSIPWTRGTTNAGNRRVR